MINEGHSSEEWGPSARQLVVIFLIGVAVCAVFFSVGFLVGYNERQGASAVQTETATPASSNAPQGESSAASSASGAPSGSIGPAGEAAQTPARGQASALSEESPPSTPKTLARAPRHRIKRSSAAPQIPSEATFAAASAKGGKFEVQVIALRTRSDALNLAHLLRARGYPANLVPRAPATPSDGLYRVEVGPYQSRAAAKSVLDKLSREGFKPFIRH